jgi:hypothetical protein
MLTLRECAIKKLLAGETSYEQVIEVTAEEMSSRPESGPVVRETA